MAVSVLVTDKNCEVVGDEIRCWQTVDCTLRFNEVGSGQFTTPAYPWIWEQLAPGNRIVVLRDREIFLAGPWERRFLERSDDGENSGVGKLTVEFADDLAHVVNRNAYPNPAQTPEGQTVDAWAYNARADQVLLDLANANAGPGARAERRIPMLTVGPAPGAGTTVAGKLRLEQLGDAMRSIALAGGGLGFRTRQVDKTKLFEVYAPRDLSGSVRFSFGLGNLRYLAYEENGPNATTALVGGQGEGADRFLLARTDAAAEQLWWRGETYVARPGNDLPADLQRDGDETLAREGATARLQSSSWDTEDQAYGKHYGLGDRVSVEVAPGQAVTDLVRLVHLQAWGTAGELVNSMVGGQDASNDPAWVKQMRQLTQRMSQLERRAMPSTPV